MNRRHYNQQYDPYDYQLRYSSDNVRDKEKHHQSGIQYQDDTFDSINSDEEMYSYSKDKDKRASYYSTQKSTEAKQIKSTKSTAPESYQSKEAKPQTQSQSHHNNSTISTEPSTSERLGRLEGMLQELIKKQIPPRETPKPKIASERKDPYNLDPRKNNFTTSMWINQIQERQIQSNWDEHTTIAFMENKMSGIIKAWYNSVSNNTLSWPEWKILITKVFPDNTDFVTTLKRLVTRIKQPDESISNYYFSKMYLIEACKIIGEDAVSCLIDGLNNQAIHDEAKSRHFLTPESLYSQFLTMLPEYAVEYAPELGQSSDVSVLHWYQDQETPPLEAVQGGSEQFLKSDFKYGDEKRRDFDNQSKHSNPIKNRPAPVHSRLDTRFIKSNQLKHTNKIPLAAKFCTVCNNRGHLARNCRNAYQMKAARLDTVSCKQCYYKECFVNNIKFFAFIDTGCSSVVIREEEASKLHLNINSVKNYIEVYGGGQIPILGESKVVLEVDRAKAEVPVVIVPNHVQDVSVIIGQEFLNKKNISMHLQNEKLKILLATC